MADWWKTGTGATDGQPGSCACGWVRSGQVSSGTWEAFGWGSTCPSMPGWSDVVAFPVVESVTEVGNLGVQTSHLERTRLSLGMAIRARILGPPGTETLLTAT